ncbi:MAG: site-specific integrase [Oscillospiraceae bacterium]|jgi:integrase|nr:site-specific integrase [Oscillospiraceae bacterium]
MAKQSKSGLPSGVIAVKNRPGLYQLRVMLHGQRVSEYYSTDETGKKKLQSELQKAYDVFKERAENGTLKGGDITDKSTFEQAVVWFINMRELELRESTQLADNFLFEHYLVPRLGKFKLKEITSPMVTKMLAELLTSGGGSRAVYVAREDFIRYMYDHKPARRQGGFNKVARDLGIGIDNTFVRIRGGKNCDKEVAQKVAKYYGMTISEAFEKKQVKKQLSASYVGKITYTLSALFTTCVKNGILLQNPVANATKPRIGEMDVPAYLEYDQIPVFLDTLNAVNINSSIRISLMLMLMLGLRSGEARGLRWVDIDFNRGIVSIEKNAGKTKNGIQLTELKTKRSKRKIELPPALSGILTQYKNWQEKYAESLGSQWQENGVVCPNTFGGLLFDSAPNKAVKRIINANKTLPCNLHAHSLRHTFISLLIADGIDVAHVANIAGDTIEIISKHYAHSFAKRRAAAMNIVGNAFAQFTSPTAPFRITGSEG